MSGTKTKQCKANPSKAERSRVKDRTGLPGLGSISYHTYNEPPLTVFNVEGGMSVIEDGDGYYDGDNGNV